MNPTRKQEPAPNPRSDYATPAALARDTALPVAERGELLRDWQDDVDAELTAEAEGMVHAPDSPAADDDLAREAQKVRKALRDLPD